MKVRGRFGPDQWHALQGAPVRAGCPWRYVRHVPSSHDALAFSVGVVPQWRTRPRSCASGAAASGLALTVSQWADRHRVLASRPAAGVEPCRISRTPKMQGIIKGRKMIKKRWAGHAKPPRLGSPMALAIRSVGNPRAFKRFPWAALSDLEPIRERADSFIP